MVSIFKKIVSFVSGASVQKKDTPIKLHKLTLAQMNKELEEYASSDNLTAKTKKI